MQESYTNVLLLGVFQFIKRTIFTIILFIEDAICFRTYLCFAKLTQPHSTFHEEESYCVYDGRPQVFVHCRIWTTASDASEVLRFTDVMLGFGARWSLYSETCQDPVSKQPVLESRLVHVHRKLTTFR
jgi:hypothetical protein